MTRVYRHFNSNKEHGLLERYSFSDWVLCSLVVASIGLGVLSHFYAKTPSTVVMTVISSIAAAVAALADGKAAWQKIAKLIITSIVVLVQFKAVSNDKATQATQTASDKNAQVLQAADFQKRFQKLLDQQELQARVSAKNEEGRGHDFTRTIGKLDQSLASEKTVFRQTRPRAAFSITEAATESKGRFALLRISNSGTDAATDAVSLLETFLTTAEPVDPGTEATERQRMISTFEAAWVDDYSDSEASKDHRMKVWHPNIAPGPLSPLQELIERPGTSSRNAVYTLYVLLRVQYSDQTGTQTFNACRETLYQPEQDAFIPFHPCDLLGKTYQPAAFATRKIYFHPASIPPK